MANLAICKIFSPNRDYAVFLVNCKLDLLQMPKMYNRMAIETINDVPVLIPVLTYGLTPLINCGSGFAVQFVENIHIAIHSRIQEFLIVFFSAIFIFVVNLRYSKNKYIICLQIDIISPFLIRSSQLIGEFKKKILYAHHYNQRFVYPIMSNNVF